MQGSENLTVCDILKSPLFKQSIVAAGSKGMDKVVEWAHILEVTQCKDYINGREIVLTTGAGWINEEDPHIFVKQLIEKNVSALCIQLGSKFNKFSTIEDIPREIIRDADKHEFPIIVFPDHAECRYVDLMRGLHSMIINKNYKIFQEQEAFLQKLHPILVKPHTLEDILRLINDHLKVNVAYLPFKGKALFIPPVTKSEQDLFKSYIDNVGQDSIITLQKDGISIAYKQVNACGQTLAHLMIFSEEYKLSSFDFMVLEKCSIVLAQDLLRDLLTNEKERKSREKWVLKWLEGRLKTHEVEQMLQSAEPFIQPAGVVACLVNCATADQQMQVMAETLLNITAIARTIFCQQGFSLMWHQSSQSMIYILIDTKDAKCWKPRLIEALHQVTELFLSINPDDSERRIAFSIGKLYTNLKHLNASLDNAKEALYVRKKFGWNEISFYDDLHVYRMIMLLENSASTESFVADYLGPIISDNKPDKNLLKTLIALRDCQYNKKDTAEKLFIARQSLYQRIKTLEGLLGEDFMSSPEKRICTEIALYALGYISKDCMWDSL
jgi:PucR family transcriptional regulator, purine catabolism regulatory protein